MRDVRCRMLRAMMRGATMRAVCASSLAAIVLAQTAGAQAPLAGGFPGRWIEANALYQPVTNDYGDWQGGYVRAVVPTARDTWYADALALSAFGERGMQVGVAQRHDWSPRFFQFVGASVGSGAAIMPRVRADASLGARWGAARSVQTTAGLSYVRSVTELYDVAALASVAWYAPRGLMLETGVRYNMSRPGDIRSQRVFASSSWTPSPRRTISARVFTGSEGWQTVRTGATLTRFNSQEYALAWREKVFGPVAISVQGDLYRNPFYTRSGITLGVARYW